METGLAIFLDAKMIKNFCGFGCYEKTSPWECYVQPDWLLIWEQRDAELIMILTDAGLHSDLFG